MFINTLFHRLVSVVCPSKAFAMFDLGQSGHDPKPVAILGVLHGFLNHLIYAGNSFSLDIDGLQTSLVSTFMMPHQLFCSLALLGMQDDATVRELAADDVSKDLRGWMQRVYAYLFHLDMAAGVASSDTLIRIHSTAEEFEAAAEDRFVVFQVSLPLTCTRARHITATCLAWAKHSLCLWCSVAHMGTCILPSIVSLSLL